VKGLEKTLENFAEIIDADEILLFERATFLVGHIDRYEHIFIRDCFLSFVVRIQLRLFHIAHVKNIVIHVVSKRSVILSSNLNYHAGRTPSNIIEQKKFLDIFHLFQ
jgi:hypothetical protein